MTIAEKKAAAVERTRLWRLANPEKYASHKDIILHGQLINAAPGQDVAKKAVGKHLQIGVVAYDNPDGSKITYLLEKEGIDAMRPTAAGIPVVGASNDFEHAKIVPGKKYDGKVTDSFWDGESGWESINFTIDNAETVEACREGYQLSCAYIPTEVDETPGEWHHVKYDAVIKNARFTHLCVVPVPRYQGATIELLNSIGGQVNEQIKKLVRAILPAKALRELANAAEEDEKKAKKDKAKMDFDNAMKNAGDDEEKKKAAKMAFDNEMAAADKPGAADDSEKKNAEERKNKVSALRNAADMFEKAGMPEKALEHRGAADEMEKLPIGGGDVVVDPGVMQAGEAPVATVGPEKSAAAIAAKDEAGIAANTAPPTDAAAMALAEEAKLRAGAGPDVNADARAAAAENFNMAEAWNSYDRSMIDEGVAAKVLVNRADRKPIAFGRQPADVKAAWRDAYRGASGATVAERCNSLKATAEKRAAASVELRNARKAEADKAAVMEATRARRFKELQNAVAGRDAGGVMTFPLLGESVQEKAALGAELYG